MYTLNRILRCVQRHVESSSVSIASLSTASNSVLLNNGQSMPTVGLGTWRTPKGQAKQIVLDAIEAGYRHFDCAYAYANEKEIGQALNEAISSGLVNRDELFIASKPWLTFFSPRRVEDCLNRSLEQLGIDHVDLYIVPWPIAFRDDDKTPYPKNADRSTAFSEDIKFEDTWFGMEKVLNLGLASSIGVSNFSEKQVQHLLDNASVTPAVNQIEHHPYLTQKQLVDYCKSKGIVITAHSPLGSPTTC
ncbi:Aldo-keto reductase family 1 member A1-A [Halotydeus destructor]|nr:Aldo-keto reductase family 1 member A1-A [Halotydeus destructor]